MSLPNIKDSKARLDDHEQALELENEKDLQGWAEAHAAGLPQEEAARSIVIRGLQKDGQWELLRSLLALEKPGTTGRYTFQFRLQDGRLSQPFLVEVYRARHRIKVRHSLPSDSAPFRSPFNLDSVLFDNCLWKAVPESKEA